MKKNILIFICFSFVSIIGFCQNRSIKFETGKWQEIKDKAKKENKIIFVDCYTTWCAPCKWMSKNIFTNDTVADFYSKNFICAKFDMEKDEGLLLVKEYNIEAYPTFIFVDGDGKIVHKGLGSKPVKSFIELGSNALNPEKQLIKLTEKFNNGNRESGFILNYLIIVGTGDKELENIKNEYFKTQKESDFISQINWTIFFYFDKSYYSREFKYFIAHKTEFAKLYTLDSVNMKINNNIDESLYKVTIKDKTGKAFEDFLKEIKPLNLDNYEEIQIHGLMNIAYIKAEWKEYAMNADIYIEKFKSNDAYTLNDIAWTFYKKIDDKILLEKAVNWAKQSVAISPSSANYDTYACLMFKIGKKDEAIKLEETALKFAKDAGESTTEYEKKIEEFKK